MPRAGGVNRALVDKADVPEACWEKYNALIASPAGEVKDMLLDLGLPTKGSKQQITVRIVRRLAGLPLSAEDAAMVEAESKTATGKRKKQLEALALPPEALVKPEDVLQQMKRRKEGTEKPTQQETAQKGVTGDCAKMPENGEEAPSGQEEATSGGVGNKRRRLEDNDENMLLENYMSKVLKDTAEAMELPEIHDVAVAAVGDVEEVAMEQDAQEETDSSEDEAAEGEGEPGAIVVPLEDDVTELMLAEDARWKKHVEVAMGVQLQVWAPAGTQNEEKAPAADEISAQPRRLQLTSPNGQQKCCGVYVLLANKSANGFPIWKLRGASRWLYSGTDGCWLVGGKKQEEQGFNCKTGFIHSGVEHGGKMPDQLQEQWRRVDGKQWVQDATISVRVAPPSPFRPGQAVKVAGLKKLPVRRLNGRFGRLLEFAEEEPPAWNVQLADGATDTLPEKALRLRPVKLGEAWIRVGSTGTGTGRAKLEVGTTASKLLVVLAGAVAGRLLRLPAADLQVMAKHWPGLGPLKMELPQRAIPELQNAGLVQLMKRSPVVAALIDAGEGLRLVIFGDAQARRVAWLHAQAIIAGAVTDYLPDDTGSAKPSSEQEADDVWRITRVPDAFNEIEDEAQADLLKRCNTMVASTGALVERMGPGALVAGTWEQRCKATAILRLGRQASKDENQITAVPMEIEDMCAQLRVPSPATAAVLELQEYFPEVCCFWVRPAPRKAAAVEAAAAEELVPGEDVEAKYEGMWCPAKLVDINFFEDSATVTWAYDGSKADLGIKDVRAKLAKSVRQRRAWLRTAWTWVVLGHPRERKIAAVSAVARMEECCPGLWTTELVDVLDELREHGAAASDVSVEARPLSGADSDPSLRGVVAKGGKAALRRAAVAAGCSMQVVGQSGLFVVGNQAERTRGLDYLRWLLAQPVYDTTGNVRRGAQGPAGRGKAGTASAVTEVEVLEAKGDKIAFRRSAASSLDLFVNGAEKVKDVASVRIDSSGGKLSLHVLGTSCGDSPTTASQTLVLKKGQEAAAEQAEALFHDCTVKAACWGRTAAARSSRADITVLRETAGHCAWLEPAALRAIERETETVVLVEYGTQATSDDWDPKAPAEVHVCGRDDTKRLTATERIRALFAGVCKEEELAAMCAGDEPGPYRVLRRAAVQLTVKLGSDKFATLEEGAAVQVVEIIRRDEDQRLRARIAEPAGWISILNLETGHRWAEKGKGTIAAAPSDADAEKARLERENAELQKQLNQLKGSATQGKKRVTDPLQELRSLRGWPKDNKEWQDVQDTVWAGHPPLAPGWIRVWSRSKDGEYYLRLRDGKATFNYQEAKTS